MKSFMDTLLSISCVRLESVKAKEERKYSRIIRTKFRPVLLAFQKGLHKAKKVLTSRREDQNRREWANLNIELLQLISKKMESISNFIIFRAVCQDWRLATDPTDAPAQLPWLIWPTVPKEKRVTDPRQHPFRLDNAYFVYSLSSEATQRIHLPVNNVPIATSSAGFMLVYDYPSSIFFLNVLTGAKVTLSFLNPRLLYNIKILGHSFSHNSSIVDTEIFLLINNFADAIDFNTKTMKYQFVRFQPPNTIKRISIILPKPAVFGYYKGRIFASIGKQRATWVYDASSGTKTSIEIPHPAGCVNFNFNFLIDAMGDLFGVMSYVRSSWKFEVYRLEHTDDFGCCRWSKMNGIGDRVLFLQDDNYGFCLMANDIKGHKGNYIYYKEKSFYGHELFTGRLCRYDIGDGTTEQLGMTSPDALWFVPSLC